MLESQLVTPCILTIFGKSKIGEYLDTRNQPNNAESAKYSIYLVLSLHGYSPAFFVERAKVPW